METVKFTERDCIKAQLKTKDSYGNKWPHKGHNFTTILLEEGDIKLPSGWKFIDIPYWGLHIRKIDDTKFPEIPVKKKEKEGENEALRYYKEKDFTKRENTWYIEDILDFDRERVFHLVSEFGSGNKDFKYFQDAVDYIKSTKPITYY